MKKVLLSLCGALAFPLAFAEDTYIKHYDVADGLHPEFSNDLVNRLKECKDSGLLSDRSVLQDVAEEYLEQEAVYCSKQVTYKKAREKREKEQKEATARKEQERKDAADAKEVARVKDLKVRYSEVLSYQASCELGELKPLEEILASGTEFSQGEVIGSLERRVEGCKSSLEREESYKKYKNSDLLIQYISLLDVGQCFDSWVHVSETQSSITTGWITEGESIYLVMENSRTNFSAGIEFDVNSRLPQYIYTVSDGVESFYSNEYQIANFDIQLCHFHQ